MTVIHWNARFGSGKGSGESAERYLREFEKKAFNGFAESETGGAAVAAARSSARLKSASITNASKEAYEGIPVWQPDPL